MKENRVMKKARSILLMLCLVACMMPLTTLQASAAMQITYVEVTNVPQTFTGEVASTADIKVSANWRNSMDVRSVYWWDETDDKMVSSSGTFVQGHWYHLHMVLTPRSGYEFPFDYDTSLGAYKGTVMVNGEKSHVAGVHSGTNLQFDGPSFQAKTRIPLVLLDKVDEPFAGRSFNLRLMQLKSRPENAATVYDRYWYDVTDGTRITSATGKFTFGHTYKLCVEFKPNDGYAFDFRNSSASGVMINITADTPYRKESPTNPGYLYFETPTFTAYTAIDSVRVLDVTEPEGGKINKTDGITVITEPADAVDVEQIYWVGDGHKMGPNEAFEEGKLYMVNVQVKAKPGYVFPTSGGSYSGFRAINGDEVTNGCVDGSSLTFWTHMRAPKSVSAIEFTNVPTPIAGQPCATSDIHLTTSPANAVTLKQLFWYDETDYRAMSETETFIAGHKYYIGAMADANEYYGFRFNGKTFDGKVTFNGEAADEAESYITTSRMLIYSKSKTANPPITSVQVTNVPTPIAGRNCTTDGIKVTTDPANTVTVYKKEWISSSGAIMTSTDKFKEGKSYFLSLELLPTEGNAFLYDSDGDYTGSLTINGEVPHSAYRYSGGRMMIHGPYVVGQKADAEVRYKTHIQMNGWETTWKKDGQMSGTSGEAKRLEGIRIDLGSTPTAGSIEYRTHIQNIGWETTWKKDGQMSGTSGEAKRLEAIQIRLAGDMAKKYDVYYRVHAQNFGWLDWAKNGESAGTAGYAYRLEGIQIKLVPKGYPAPGSTKTPYRHPMVSYTTHVQDYGWQANVLDGVTSGTVGKAKRLEAIKIQLKNQEYAGNIEYKTHIQNIGWETSWKKNGAMSGTSGKAYRLEAIRLRLTGEMAEKYDIYYRVHAQNFGWMGWAKNGASAGTAGYAYRLEGIQIKVVPKGDPAPGSTANCFRQK